MPQHATRPIAHRQRPSRMQLLKRRILVGVSAGLGLTLTAGVAFAAVTYNDLMNGINRSSFTLPDAPIAPPKAKDAETNILVMGLDSRVDQNGNALPEHVYQALRAGDENDGGYNANVLMLLHIPAGSEQATAISIPRDNYVELVDAPGGVENSKIKEAYGLAFYERLAEEDGAPSPAVYQEARAAGRQAQIATVSRFLGDVRIDHFVEVTMAAFYDIATAVEPIPVCLNQATQDKYSGADFVAGEQELSAAEAMSFVRQRRDTGPSDLELTDFDRTRRQQAFIVSLAHKLNQTNVFLDVKALRSLINTTKTHLAIDDELELFSFALRMSNLAEGNLDFVTLPIERFDTIDGKAVNIVDLDQVHAIVQDLIGAGAGAATDAPGDTGTPSDTAPQPDATPDSDAKNDSVDQPQEHGHPAPDAEQSNVYNDWETPLRSGAVPCVN